MLSLLGAHAHTLSLSQVPPIFMFCAFSLSYPYIYSLHADGAGGRPPLQQASKVCVLVQVRLRVCAQAASMCVLVNVCVVCQCVCIRAGQR